ncbi:hypothetical protein [Aliarcobacter butzleri]|uniref:Uncharacterized protein n=1 Tax=Aliarcobacter butzleri TaxID=28197 RepID=A0AAW6VIU6_9BACT|nr:hypothetical protein [Aliarcobacter butzleri]MDK2042447.1 hypothetical protein [Aliarcobacter butzleri]MDK2097542.1 hypothetical protein [Aliarcobacter butzleri]MDN5130804.1 hypothetical protein [Aliarcobacter butzleri]
MKILLIVTTLFANILFANYNYMIQDNGKIDMHGGKSENLIDEKNSLSNKDFKNIGINKPTTPKAPQNLIKKEEKKENSK